LFYFKKPSEELNYVHFVAAGIDQLAYSISFKALGFDGQNTTYSCLEITP
jgi:hypothetical protein